jgi:hypothetical protein
VNSLGEVIKNFFEKHLFPTLISIVLSIVTYLILPDNLYGIKELGF